MTGRAIPDVAALAENYQGIVCVRDCVACDLHLLMLHALKSPALLLHPYISVLPATLAHTHTLCNCQTMHRMCIISVTVLQSNNASHVYH